MIGQCSGDGAMWFRWGRNGSGWQLFTPRWMPSFSERNGYKVPVFSFFGYRVFRLERLPNGSIRRHAA
jgi:hypothetical protein